MRNTTNKPGWSVSSVFFNVGFILLSLACIVPLALVVIVSFSPQQSITLRGYSFFPTHVTGLGYEFLFKDSAPLLRAYAVSIAVTTIGTVLSLLLMGTFAYPLSRRDYPYRGMFMFYLFFTMLFNGGMTAQYIVFTKLYHLTDSYVALILPWLIVPFNVIVMRTFFQNNIHPALIESAKIDGAGELRIFFRIIVPLSLPVFATMALFCTFNYWNDWFSSLLFINDPEKYPLQYLMMKAINDAEYLRRSLLTAVPEASRIIAQYPGDSVRMAMVIVGMGPIIFVYPFFQKYFVKGLTIGAVKE